MKNMMRPNPITKIVGLFFTCFLNDFCYLFYHYIESWNKLYINLVAVKINFSAPRTAVLRCSTSHPDFSISQLVPLVGGKNRARVYNIVSFNITRRDAPKTFIYNLIPFLDIENLSWRGQLGTIQRNSTKPPVQAPRFIDMDFSLMDFQRYWREHKKEFPAMSEKYLEGFTHVGCAWREKLGCSFCDIPYPFNNYQARGRFWRDLREAKHSMGIESFKDYGDCLTGNHERVRALLEGRPSDLEDMEISCYGRSKEITEEMADMLKELNVRYVYIGLDSGDNKMLRSMQEGYTVKSNYDSVGRLAKRGINVTASLILGAEGESEETIANTERFAREIVKYPNLTQLYCAMLTPFPAAPMNRRFLEANSEYTERDIWDTEQTKRFWIDNYCEADYDYIEAKAREINDLNPSSRKRYFGLKRD